MDFNEYQNKAWETAKYPNAGQNHVYPTLGLNGEAGEIAEKVKKNMRDGTPLDRESMKKEIGDVLWYCAALARELDIPLNDVAQTNIDKLTSRKERGVLGGSGDDR